jgi:hypothetical protein
MEQKFPENKVEQLVNDSVSAAGTKSGRQIIINIKRMKPLEEEQSQPLVNAFLQLVQTMNSGFGNVKYGYK